MKKKVYVQLLACLFLMGTILGHTNIVKATTDNGLLAQPTMGWNTFDSYYDSADLNETNIKAQADYMAANMKSSGYIYINLDGGWWNNGSGGAIQIDEYGRPQPGTTRFPSSANGVGLKSLADYVHSKGLKLGIYAIRGIPRVAATSSVTIKGTSVTGEQLANTADICAWTSDNYGLHWDTYSAAAQAYYTSLFELWESWGVDLVKMDDINDSTSTKYTAYSGGVPPYRAEDINGYVAARTAAGSYIVICGSPGRGLTDDRVQKLLQNFDTTRASSDVWDSWYDVRKLFNPAKNWAQYTSSSNFLDLDMMPFGTLRKSINVAYSTSALTQDEVRTSFALHLIARSPIIMGGILTQMDSTTLSLLTNTEAIAVNQSGTNQNCFYDDGSITKWVSDSADGMKYVALFNRKGTSAEISFNFADIGLSNICNVRNLWTRSEVGTFEGSYSVTVPSHGAVLLKVTQATTLELTRDEETLTAQLKKSDGTDYTTSAAVTYEWYRDNELVSGVDDFTYTLSDEDKGAGIQVRVSQYGLESNIIDILDDSTNEAIPVIVEITRDEETLIAQLKKSDGTDFTTDAAVTYEWYRDNDLVSGIDDCA